MDDFPQQPWHRRNDLLAVQSIWCQDQTLISLVGPLPRSSIFQVTANVLSLFVIFRQFFFFFFLVSAVISQLSFIVEMLAMQEFTSNAKSIVTTHHGRSKSMVIEFDAERDIHGRLRLVSNVTIVTILACNPKAAQKRYIRHCLFFEQKRSGVNWTAWIPSLMKTVLFLVWVHLWRANDLRTTCCAKKKFAIRNPRRSSRLRSCFSCNVKIPILPALSTGPELHNLFVSLCCLVCLNVSDCQNYACCPSFPQFNETNFAHFGRTLEGRCVLRKSERGEKNTTGGFRLVARSKCVPFCTRDNWKVWPCLIGVKRTRTEGSSDLSLFCCQPSWKRFRRWFISIAVFNVWRHWILLLWHGRKTVLKWKEHAEVPEQLHSARLNWMLQHNILALLWTECLGCLLSTCVPLRHCRPAEVVNAVITVNRCNEWRGDGKYLHWQNNVVVCPRVMCPKYIKKLITSASNKKTCGHAQHKTFFCSHCFYGHCHWKKSVCAKQQKIPQASQPYVGTAPHKHCVIDSVENSFHAIRMVLPRPAFLRWFPKMRSHKRCPFSICHNGTASLWKHGQIFGVLSRNQRITWFVLWPLKRDLWLQRSRICHSGLRSADWICFPFFSPENSEMQSAESCLLPAPEGDKILWSVIFSSAEHNFKLPQLGIRCKLKRDDLLSCVVIFLLRVIDVRTQRSGTLRCRNFKTRQARHTHTHTHTHRTHRILLAFLLLEHDHKSADVCPQKQRLKS